MMTVVAVRSNSRYSGRMSDDSETCSAGSKRSAINPLGALLGVPNGRLLELPDALIVQESVIKECVPVAAAKGIALDAVEMMEATREVCRKTAANLCSMLQDLRAGRRTEIDSINGAFARFGREAGVAAPYNELLARLVRAKEREASS